MEISAMVNLLADSGMVPSRSSPWALTQVLEPRPLRPSRTQNKQIPSQDSRSDTNPSIGAILESKEGLALNDQPL
eukprot:5251827-Amphidinium_carterae.1